MIQLCPETIVSKQKHGNDSNPDLRHHRVLAGSKEALDLQILLDPFKEQLYLPPLPIDIGNGAS